MKKNENELENNYAGGAQTASETEGGTASDGVSAYDAPTDGKTPGNATRLSETAVQP